MSPLPAASIYGLADIKIRYPRKQSKLDCNLTTDRRFTNLGSAVEEVVDSGKRGDLLLA